MMLLLTVADHCHSPVVGPQTAASVNVKMHGYVQK